MAYNSYDGNPGALPYLGATTYRNLVELSPEVAARLHLERMRREWSVRRLAQDVSLISERDAMARRLAHGDSARHDASGLRVTHQALAKIDRMGMEQVEGREVAPLPVSLSIYALIHHWLGERPYFARARQHAFYESRWKPVYDAEKQRQAQEE